MEEAVNIPITISDETYQLVQSKAVLPFDGGTKLKSGSWRCEISEEVADRLVPLMLKGETLSETIYRILSRQQS